MRPLLPALLVALAGASLAACSDGPARPRNLLVVCVDTLRADELGAYGREPSATPALDALAARGAVFERAHAAASWTLPSVAALFTSLYPSTTGLWTFEDRLSDAFPTLAERFRDAGFATHGVASHVFFDADYGLQQGFESFDDELCHRKGEPGWRPITAPEVSRRAADWITARAADEADRPWLLFAHFFDPHLDYLDHEASDPAASTRDERDRYRSEIAFTDRHVGALLDALAASGQADETAVLFFSDHGEAFLEHPPIRRHSYGLYEEELRVPLLLAVPGIAPRRVADFVRTVDVLPTLLDLFGLDDPAAALREGRSLVPLLLGREAPPGPAQLAEIRLKDGYHADALVRAPYKLYHDRSNARVRLYDLAADPAERHDLSAERPELAAELRAALDAARDAAAAKGARFGPGGKVEHSPEDLRHLQELGYAGDEPPDGD